MTDAGLVLPVRGFVMSRQVVAYPTIIDVPFLLAVSTSLHVASFVVGLQVAHEFCYRVSCLVSEELGLCGLEGDDGNLDAQHCNEHRSADALVPDVALDSGNAGLEALVPKV